MEKQIPITDNVVCLIDYFFSSLAFILSLLFVYKRLKTARLHVKEKKIQCLMIMILQIPHHFKMTL